MVIRIFAVLFLLMLLSTKMVYSFSVFEFSFSRVGIFFWSLFLIITTFLTLKFSFDKYIKNFLFLLFLFLLLGFFSFDPIHVLKSYLLLIMTAFVFFVPVLFKIRSYYVVSNTTIYLGLLYVVVGLIVNGWSEGNEVRFYGLSFEPNISGAILSFFALVSYSLMNRNYNYVFYLLFFITFLLLTLSRGPFLGLFISLLLYMFLVGKQRTLYLTFFILLCAVIFIVYNPVGFIGRMDSVNARLVMYSEALNQFFDNPIFGNGLFSFRFITDHSILALVGSNSDWDLWIPNLFLLILHDFGAIGFLVFISFFGAMINLSYKNFIYMKSKGGNVSKRGAVIVATLILFLVISMFTPLILEPFFWFILGVVVADYRGIRVEKNIS